MPSPFPGMDPYLEGPRWMGFHHQLISEIARQLAPKLRPKYVALTTERVVIETPEAVPQGSVEIRAVVPEALVTAIEVLSSTNKRGEGREEYSERRQRFVRSTAHLVEIDLLRTGQRVLLREALPYADYFVFVSHDERAAFTEVWPVSLNQSLPTVPIPLLAGDSDVTLDLQAAFNAVYEAVGYDLLLKYDRPPQVALTLQQQAWADMVLAKWRK